MTQLTILKATPADNFTLLPNELLRCSDLSWGARGLLCYYLSLPPKWKAQTSDVIGAAPDGKQRFYSLKKELEDAGYLRSLPVRGARGRVVRWVLQVTATPHHWPDDDAPQSKKPESSEPDSGCPDTGKPETKKDIDPNTDQRKKDTPPNPLKGEEVGVDGSPSAQSEPSEPLTHFDPVALRQQRLPWEVQIRQADPAFLLWVEKVLPPKEDKATARRTARAYVQKARTNPERFDAVLGDWQQYQQQLQEQAQAAQDDELQRRVMDRIRRTGY